MSLSFQPLTPVAVLDPRVIIDNERTYAILKSGSQTTWKQYTTTSISNSSLNFSCPPPSGGVIVDRKMYMYLPIRLTFIGTPPNGETIIRANRDAPRAFPISSSIETLQASINNQSMSINIADIVHALMHYNTDNDVKNLDYSMTPSYQDQSQNYSDLFNSIRGPLQNYGDASDGVQTPRGGFPFVIISNPVSNGVNAVTAVVDVAFCEPLYLSPFYWGKSNASGFFNVNTMDFNFTFLGNAANRFWSHDSNNGTNIITSSSFTFGGLSGGPTSFTTTGNLPLMLFQYITPQTNMVLPPNVPITYPYFDVLRFPTDLPQSIAGSGQTTASSNNIQLNSIPRRMYVYVRERNSDLYSSASNTDTFFQINNINIQFQNKNGLLASASMNQLYQMSVANHCKMNWTQWSGGPVYAPGNLSATYGTIGSVVCIEFATNIGLNANGGQAPGLNEQSMLQINVTYTNVSGRNINPTLYIVPVLEGTFTIQGLGQSSTNIGVISPKDVIDSESRPGISYADVEDVNGGDFWSGLKSFGSKLLPFLQKAHDFVKEHKLLSRGLSMVPHPGAQGLSKIADTLGYGEGGVLLGGAKLSRSQMRRRLNDY